MTKAREIAELGQKLTVDASGNLDIAGNITSDGFILGNNDTLIFQDSNGTNRNILQFTTGNNIVIGGAGAGVNDITLKNNGAKNRLNVGVNGDIQFYNSDGSAAKFHWDAADQRLGLGTTTPSSKVHLVESDPKVELTRTSDFYYGRLSADGFSAFTNANGNAPVIFRTATNERMRITSDGKIGIGTNSPSSLLDLYSTAAPVISLDSSDSTGQRGLNFQYNGSTYGQIGQDPQTGELRIRSGETGQGGYYIKFDTGGTERARFDTSGNFLVGHTAESTWASNNGATLRGTGVATLTSTSTPPLYVTRRGDGSNDNGNIVVVRNNDSNIGSLGHYGNAFYISGTGTLNGLMFNGSLEPTRETARADNVMDIGSNNYRFKDLYLAGVMKTGTSQRTSFGTAGFWDNATSGNDTGVRVGGLQMYISDGNGSPTDGTRDIGGSTRRIRDIYLSGGAYIGGTASANRLDDYEEGTWNPASGIGTATVTGTATYVKIGKMVFIAADVQMPNQTNSNQARIIGLPFTPYQRGTNSEYNLSPGEHTYGSYIALALHSSYPAIVFRPNGGGSVAYTTVSAKRFRFSGWYETT